jgi:hypothetical protein
MYDFLINIELDKYEIANLLIALKTSQGEWRNSIISKIQTAVENLHIKVDK